MFRCIKRNFYNNEEENTKWSTECGWSKFYFTLFIIKDTRFHQQLSNYPEFITNAVQLLQLQE